jgi:hypothetical protein
VGKRKLAAGTYSGFIITVGPPPGVRRVSNRTMATMSRLRRKRREMRDVPAGILIVHSGGDRLLWKRLDHVFASNDGRTDRALGDPAASSQD